MEISVSWVFQQSLQRGDGVRRSGMRGGLTKFPALVMHERDDRTAAECVGHECQRHGRVGDYPGRIDGRDCVRQEKEQPGRGRYRGGVPLLENDRNLRQIGQ